MQIYNGDKQIYYNATLSRLKGSYKGLIFACF